MSSDVCLTYFLGVFSPSFQFRFMRASCVRQVLLYAPFLYFPLVMQKMAYFLPNPLLFVCYTIYRIFLVIKYSMYSMLSSFLFFFFFFFFLLRAFLPPKKWPVTLTQAMTMLTMMTNAHILTYIYICMLILCQARVFSSPIVVINPLISPSPYLVFSYCLCHSLSSSQHRLKKCITHLPQPRTYITLSLVLCFFPFLFMTGPRPKRKIIAHLSCFIQSSSFLSARHPSQVG
ncbi:hypothetical protein F4810DRAFT_685813 [Camillea tinctor]|nr:hypothetical protein F4810DRAFT_685813 [Camillea tinctor]